MGALWRGEKFIIISGLIDIEVDIQENGLYVLGKKGGTGKTYLATQLQKLNDTGVPVSVVTFLDNKIFIDGDIDKADLILYDRADLYINNIKIQKDLEKYSKCKIVLIDLKNTNRLQSILMKDVNISLSKDKIIVRWYYVYSFRRCGF